MRKTLLALLLLAIPAPAEDLAEMARNVRNYETKFLLIAKGREAVPYLMAQLEDEDEWIVFESKSALRWIASHARRDPRKRRVLATELTLYCSNTGPVAARAIAAELLGDLGEQTTIGTLVAMTRDRDVALDAVDALRRIPGAAATDGLVSALKGSDRAAGDAIYHAFGSRRDPRVLPILIRGADAENRAAIEALGRMDGAGALEPLERLVAKKSVPAFLALLDRAVRLGDPALLVRLFHADMTVPPAKPDDAAALPRPGAAELKGRVIRAAGEARVFDIALVDLLVNALATPDRVAAQRAILSIAEATDAATGAPFVRSILEDAEDPGIIVRALAGCGRIGDPQAVTLAVKHVTSPSLNVSTTAIGALRDIPGEAATTALLEALDKEQRTGVAAIYIDALGDRGDPRAADRIAQRMLEGPERVRTAAIDAYVKLAAIADEQTARGMYMRALDAGATRPAVAGLSRVGDATALEPLAAIEGDLKPAALDAMVTIADRFEGDAALAAYRRALEAGAPVENRLRELGEAVTITARDGHVSAWWIIGPFAAPDIEDWEREEFPETGVDLEKEYEIGGKTVRWMPVAAGGDDAILDFNANLSPNDYVAGYAFAEIIVRKERDAVLRVASDDGIIVWINGEKVHSNLVYRGITQGEDTIEVHLKEGSNRLLVKVCEGQGGWACYAHFEDDKSRPLKFKIR